MASCGAWRGAAGGRWSQLSEDDFRLLSKAAGTQWFQIKVSISGGGTGSEGAVALTQFGKH